MKKGWKQLHLHENGLEARHDYLLQIGPNITAQARCMTRLEAQRRNTALHQRYIRELDAKKDPPPALREWVRKEKENR